MVEAYARDPLQLRYGPNEWRVLTICTLLNQTRRSALEPRLDEFFRRWSGPWQMSKADPVSLLTFLTEAGWGLAVTRSVRLPALARAYMEAKREWPYCFLGRTAVLAIPGCGEYAADAVSVLLHHDYSIIPADKVLRRRVELMTLKEEPEWQTTSG